MKLADRLKLFFASAGWPNISSAEFDQQMEDVWTGKETRSRVKIDSRSAMSISAFFCGVNLIMGAMASMKWVLYQRFGETGRKRLRTHPLYKILHDRANQYTTAHQWKRVILGHLLLWGNHYSIMLRDPYSGEIITLERILHPSQVSVQRDKKTGKLSYDIVYGPNEKETLAREGPRFIFHIPGPGFNGVTGFSLISLARESLGLTAAMEQFGGNFFGQGVNAGGFLEMPDGKKMSDDAVRRLKESVTGEFSGLSNSHKFIVLEEGAKFNRNTIPLEDAQFLLSRTFQIDEIARWLNLSPSRLKELTRATFSNIEQLQIMDLQDCFLPWCDLIESETNAQLIEAGEQDALFSEFLMDSLLRADSLTRANTLAIKRQWGVLNADEWREKDNENPLPDGQGQIYILPSNYTIAEKLREEPGGPVRLPAPGKKPAAPDEPPAEDEETAT
jgi:HK97 family phage portal protein